MNACFHANAEREFREQEAGLQARILEELDALTKALESHEVYNGTLRSLGTNKRLKGVKEVKWKDHRHSVRIYYLVDDGDLTVLHIDPSKRRTAMSKGTTKLLIQRRKDVLDR